MSADGWTVTNVNININMCVVIMKAGVTQPHMKYASSGYTPVYLRIIPCSHSSCGENIFLPYKPFILIMQIHKVHMFGLLVNILLILLYYNNSYTHCSRIFWDKSLIFSYICVKKVKFIDKWKWTVKKFLGWHLKVQDQSMNLPLSKILNCLLNDSTKLGT